MKILFDLFPIILFFFAYKTYNIFVATVVAMLATFLQLIYTRMKSGTFQKTHLISFVMITILGGATLYSQNELFIKWKPSVVYWIIGIIFIGSNIFSKKTIMQHLAGTSIKLSDKLWRKLNISWGGYFIFMGFANLYVIYNFSTDFWVNFKLFGTLGLTLLFAILQGLVILKYADKS